MKLVDEARNWWKLYSVQLMALLAFLSVLEANWSVLSMFVPASLHPYVVAAFAVAAIVGRLIDQKAVVVEGQEKKLGTLAEQLENVYDDLHDAYGDAKVKLAAKQVELRAEYDRLLNVIRAKKAEDPATPPTPADTTTVKD